MMKADLDARTIERNMSSARTAVLREALLNEKGEQCYSLILRESCSYSVELVSTLPSYDIAAFSEILKRDTVILSNLESILSRLPDRQSVDDFDADYRRLIIQRLDRIQLYGARLQSDYGQRYPLSVAYMSLAAAKREAPSTSSTVPSRALQRSRVRRRPASRSARNSVQSPGLTAGDTPVEQWLASGNRFLIVGEAGSGKTTLLQWLAVTAARKDFSSDLASWNSYIPFLIPLRRYASDALPSPEEFPAGTAKNILAEMPERWVHGHLKKGRGLILIDGLDELKEGQPRERALDWLQDLIDTFPNCAYVFTSRPAAVNDTNLPWRSFISLELRPMTPSKVSSFIDHWHEAMRVELVGHEERERLSFDRSALLTSLESDRHLRMLCVNPLLCALLCALNRERHGHLPKDRMGVYRGALEMLLDMRDRQRGVHSSMNLSSEAKLTLLQDLALYLVRNGWSDAPHDRVCELLGRSSRTLSEVTAKPAELLQYLLERSGFIRSPGVGRIDFIHRSFQEYLPARLRLTMMK